METRCDGNTDEWKNFFVVFKFERYVSFSLKFTIVLKFYCDSQQNRLSIWMTFMPRHGIGFKTFFHFSVFPSCQVSKNPSLFRFSRVFGFQLWILKQSVSPVPWSVSTGLFELLSFLKCEKKEYFRMKLNIGFWDFGLSIYYAVTNIVLFII